MALNWNVCSHFFHFRSDYSWSIQSKCQQVILLVTGSHSNEQFITTEDPSNSLLYIDGSEKNNYNLTHQQKHHQKLMHTDHVSLLHYQVSQSWMDIVSCYLLLSANSPACCSQQWSRLHSGMPCYERSWHEHQRYEWGTWNYTPNDCLVATTDLKLTA